MRVVLDTNVLISGLLLPGGVPGQIVRAWQDGQFTLVMSEQMLDEIERVLQYPKIQRRVKWTAGQVERYIVLLHFYADIISVEAALSMIPAGRVRDSKDVPILATLLAGQADWLVSGDDDLLTLRDQYSICSPAEFLALLGPAS